MLIFVVGFFRSEDFMPSLKSWRAEKYLEQSKGYQAIGQIQKVGLEEEDAVTTAEKAFLLAPSNMEIHRNLALVYYKVDPITGLKEWADIATRPDASAEDHLHVVDLALESAKSSKKLQASMGLKHTSSEKTHKAFLKIAQLQLEDLAQDKTVADSIPFRKALAGYIAEFGEVANALKAVKVMREKVKGQDTWLDLFFCRLAISLQKESKDKTIPEFEEAEKLLRKLSEGEGQSALDAIGHFRGLHLVKQRTKDEIRRLHELLDRKHDASEERLIIKCALYSMELSLAGGNEEVRKRIIERCGNHFDQQFDLLLDDAALEKYCHWLGAHHLEDNILKALPMKRASGSEKLVKVRLGALANLGDFEALERTLDEATILEEHWRDAFSARAKMARSASMANEHDIMEHPLMQKGIEWWSPDRQLVLHESVAKAVAKKEAIFTIFDEEMELNYARILIDYLQTVKETEIRLTSLVDSIYQDEERVQNIYNWFLISGDQESLQFILERLFEEPSYKAFCAKQLLTYKGKFAPLKEIQSWTKAMADSEPDDLSLQNTLVYWNLLSPEPSPPQLQEWREFSGKHLKENPLNLQFRVTNALALLRLDFPVKALSVLKTPSGSSRPTNWERVRPSWARIYAIALSRSNQTEDSIALLETLSKKPYETKAEENAIPMLFGDVIEPPSKLVEQP
tara:strand:- start:19975 stop:22026 length:2052 start_codon:yes stop_codon:yes gene_type:complete